MTWRRFVAYSLIALLLAAGVAWLMLPSQQQERRAGFGRRGAGNMDQPVPTLATAARTADMPVFFDGVGTVRALNTVTVNSQVDGKLIRLNFREGQDVERGQELAKIDPAIYQAQYDQAVAKKSAGRSAAGQRTARPRTLHAARRHQRGAAAAGRRATCARRTI
jgi:multidrug efflux system membrane fusion protein